MNTWSRDGRRIIGSVVIGLAGVILITSAVAKIAQVPPVVVALSQMGIGGYKLMLVAALEMASALLLLRRSTRTAGLLLVSAFLGGAIATHLEHDQAITPPAVLLSIIWFGAWLRQPALLWAVESRAASGVAVTDGAAGTAGVPR